MLRNAMILIPLLTLGVALLAAAPSTAHACSCIGLSPEQAFSNADAVFEGRVVSVEPSEFAGQPCGGFCPPLIVRLRVVRTWKAADAEEVSVYTMDGGSSCGIAFAPETSWLVYARNTPNERLSTGLCSGTVRVEEAAEAIQALGAGVTPVDPGPEPDPADDPGADDDTGDGDTGDDDTGDGDTGDDDTGDDGTGDDGTGDGDTPDEQATLPRTAPASGGCASCSLMSAGQEPLGATALVAALSLALTVRRRR